MKKVSVWFLWFQGGIKDLLQFVKEKDADKVSVSLATSLDTVAELELLQVYFLTYRHA